jgi:lipopolysaccharide export system protein LptC
MFAQSGGWFVSALLVALAALTFWLDRIAQPAPAAARDVSNLDPDYIVDGLSAFTMDAQGRLTHTLRAQKMTHYPDEDLTVLIEPRFVAYAEDQPPVTVTSRQARMSGNGENVYFEREVRVVRAPSENTGELVVETNFLHVIPDAKIAQTDQPVTIREANLLVNASGLELNSDTRVLQLFGRVKGTLIDQPSRTSGHAP